jgi:pyruvate ferredoxin oxidoreductase alpha subunit
MLPIMVGLDGFIVSHTLENVETLGDEAVKKFVGPRLLPKILTHEGKMAPFKLDPDNPMTMGPIALPNYYFEFKRQQDEAMNNALDVIQKINDEYFKISGRKYGNGLIETYRLSDADIATVCLGSTAGTMKTVVDELRQEGVKAGLLRLRAFRPLPVREIVHSLERVKAVAVMDKSMSFGGNGGAVYHEIRHALYDAENPPIVVDYIYGLGGRDASPDELRSTYHDLQKMLKTRSVTNPVQYLGLRE